MKKPPHTQIRRNGSRRGLRVPRRRRRRSLRRPRGPGAGPRPAPLGASAVAPLPRVVVDLDVVADTLPLESEVYLETLQHLRPEGPWAELRELPDHRWRTFDLSAKFARVLAERRVARPAEATMILRLLFEEDEVGKRALAARDDPSGQRWDGGGWAPTEGDLAGVRPGTRPLTAGEVVENWDETLYYGGSPQLTLQLGAALKQEVDARTAGLHLCRWVKRWTPGGAPPPTLTSFTIIQLENDHRDFRLALG
ncbi:hypothetical protein JL722_6840 [Aureococcus anophagefferens]|nr:hypothetical protein JL722_6840 [Aureococcus anophagefferens]